MADTPGAERLDGPAPVRRAPPAGPRRWRLTGALAAGGALLAAGAIGLLLAGGMEARQAAEADRARVMEAIRAADPDQAAANLGFLLETGLVRDAELALRLRAWLAQRSPGQGPALAAGPGIARREEHRAFTAIARLEDAHPARRPAPLVAVLEVPLEPGGTPAPLCNGVLLPASRFLTMEYCTRGLRAGGQAWVAVPDGGMARVLKIPVDSAGLTLQPIPIAELRARAQIGIADDAVLGVALLEFPAARIVTELRDVPPVRAPRAGERVHLVAVQIADMVPVTFDEATACVVEQVYQAAFATRCPSPAGSAGAVIVAAEDGAMLGLVSFGGAAREFAVRLDAVRGLEVMR